jgi:hypothetical protein
MLYKAKVGVCCNINTIHINTVGQNVEIVNFKRGGTYSDHWVLEG